MLTSDSYFLLLKLRCSQFHRIDEHLSQIYPRLPIYLSYDRVVEHQQTATNPQILQV
jgi:hypothetical protein